MANTSYSTNAVILAGQGKELVYRIPLKRVFLGRQYLPTR
jgi:hypothetical protein